MPANIYLGYTAPINPEGATPVLTKEQVWAGLQHKIRFAQEFVPAIATCDVTHDGGEGGEVRREVVFKAHPSDRVLERVVSYKPLKIEFHQANGSVVTNIVSDGPKRTPEDMWMTYAFQLLDQPCEPGSEEERKLKEDYSAKSMRAVVYSIDTIRKMVKESRI